MNVSFNLFGESTMPIPLPREELWYNSEVIKVCAVALTVFALSASPGYAILAGIFFALRGPILLVAFSIFCVISQKKKEDSDSI